MDLGQVADFGSTPGGKQFEPEGFPGRVRVAFNENSLVSSVDLCVMIVMINMIITIIVESVCLSRHRKHST